jgi:hypothetical protein
MGFNGASQLMLPDEDQRNQPTNVAGRRSTQPANKSCRTKINATSQQMLPDEDQYSKSEMIFL